MNSRDLYIGFNELDDEILERSETATVSKTVRFRRRLTAALIAAILALLMLGAGIVTGLLGDDIQSWFAHYWETLTGQPMSDQHVALIDHLSQEIGLSETVDGVTITVDSATEGDGNIFILLRVEGLKFSTEHRYGFEDSQMKLFLESVEDNRGATFSCKHLGLDANGAALLLFNYSLHTQDTSQEDSPPFQCTLTLTNFMQNPRDSDQVLLAEGSWLFTFSLDRNNVEIKKLPNTRVKAVYYSENNEPIKTQVLLTNITLTNTSLRFQYDRQDIHVVTDVQLHEFRVVLSGGREIVATRGSQGVYSDDKWYCTYFWEIPIALDEVVVIKIGDVEIPVA